jgi:hypothetical protein
MDHHLPLRLRQYLENRMRAPSPRCQLQMVTNQHSPTLLGIELLPRSLSKFMAHFHKSVQPQRTPRVRNAYLQLSWIQLKRIQRCPHRPRQRIRPHCLLPPNLPTTQHLTFQYHLRSRRRDFNTLHKRTQPQRPSLIRDLSTANIPLMFIQTVFECLQTYTKCTYATLYLTRTRALRDVIYQRSLKRHTQLLLRPTPKAAIVRRVQLSMGM